MRLDITCCFIFVEDMRSNACHSIGPIFTDVLALKNPMQVHNWQYCNKWGVV